MTSSLFNIDSTHKSSNLSLTQLESYSNIPLFSKNDVFTLTNLEKTGNIKDLTNVLKNTTFISPLINTDSISLTNLKFPDGSYFKDVSNIPGIGKPFSLSQFERIHSKAENLSENLNPLNIEKFVSDLESQLIQNNFNLSSIDEEISSINTNVNRMLSEIFNLNNSMLNTQELFKSITNNIDPYLKNDSISIQYKNLLSKFLILFDSDYVIKTDSSVYEQLHQLKTFIFSFYLTITNLTNSSLLPQNYKNELTELNKILFSYRDSYESININYEKYAYMCYEKLRLFNKTNGKFQPLEKINIKYREFSERAKVIEKMKNHPVFQYVRPSFLETGHPSVPKTSTDFGNKGFSIADKIEAIEEMIPVVEQAAFSIGEGEKIQRDKNIESMPAPTIENGSCGPLTGVNWEKYLDVLGEKESGNNYQKVNSVGYCGRWQFGSTQLIDSGLVKPGTNTRNLNYEKVWTGYNDIKSREDWLSNKNNVQDLEIINLTNRNYKALLKLNVINRRTSIEEVAGYLAVAHLKGAGGAKKFKNGIDNADAFGNKTSDYYNMMKNSLKGSNPDSTQSKIAESLGGDISFQNEIQANSTTLADSPSIFWPYSNRAPVYPYNSVNESESGHLIEIDDSPGSERLNFRHRTGGGYEILADGTTKMFSVGDKYEAVLGNDFIIVNGNVQVVVLGDAGIRVGGSMNLDIAEDMNFRVGGNFNFDIQGDIKENISGSKISNVSGDEVHSTGGFYKQTASGDLQIDGSSITNVARAGNINFMGTESIKMYSNNKMTMASQGDINIASLTRVLHSGSDTVSGVSGSGITYKTSNFSLKTDVFNLDSGSTSIKSGSEIQVYPKVSHANYADQANQANRAGSAAYEGAGGSAIKPAYNTNSVEIDDEESRAWQNDLQGDVMNNLGDFEAFDTDKSQAYARGDESDVYDGKGNSVGLEGISF